MPNLHPRLSFTRRRMLSIVAAGAALPFGKVSASELPASYRWQGLALGAVADLTLYAETRAKAMEAIDASLSEISRLEGIFSLHRPESTISRLNATGRLDSPPSELVELLSLALSLSDRSGGCFDPSIQPLWRLLADHFAQADPLPTGPTEVQIAAVRHLVDWRDIELSPARIAFAKPGMQLTLNGIAQGYISDRVAALLKKRGFSHCLVNLGELYALGAKPDGTPWQIGLSEPGKHGEQRISEPLESGAMATSAGAGLCFDRDGLFNHIVDARSGQCADPAMSVTVRAQSAALADGLSTIGAMAAKDQPAFNSLLKAFAAQAVILSSRDLALIRLG